MFDCEPSPLFLVLLIVLAETGLEVVIFDVGEVPVKMLTEPPILSSLELSVMLFASLITPSKSRLGNDLFVLS